MGLFMYCSDYLEKAEETNAIMSTMSVNATVTPTPNNKLGLCDFTKKSYCDNNTYHDIALLSISMIR